VVDWLDQAKYLGVLARAPATSVKDFAEELLPALGPIEVLQNRTGLVMLPLEESVKGATFYVGEVLVSEARVRLVSGEGYGACLGRDLHQALALAIVDAAMAANLERNHIAAYLERLTAALDLADGELVDQVEATRVEMETF
jgi:alpha-D-ribose 1-methylphosphonate 5-triphosphate synthase subunit PhnG